MAAKTLKEAITMAITICPTNEDVQQRLVNELRDYVAHRVMILGDNATTYDLFDDLFSETHAFPNKLEVR